MIERLNEQDLEREALISQFKAALARLNAIAPNDVLVNDKELTEFVLSCLSEVVGEDVLCGECQDMFPDNFTPTT